MEKYPLCNFTLSFVKNASEEYFVVTDGEFVINSL